MATPSADCNLIFDLIALQSLAASMKAISAATGSSVAPFSNIPRHAGSLKVIQWPRA
jgi:hypothetical protein